MIYKLNGQDITNKAFKHNGYSYPRNWCHLASQEQLDALGITVEPDPEPVVIEPEPQYKTQFTSLEFLDRFTPAEQLTVVQATLQDAQVKLWYDKLLAAEFIDLADPRTEEGIDALIGARLLAAERKAVLMSPEQVGQGE